MLDQKIKKRAVHRAKIITGQVKGLVKAIEQEVYCTDLLNQSLSIQNSLKSLNGLLLENHLKTHVQHQMHQPKQADRAIKELLAAFTLCNK